MKTSMSSRLTTTAAADNYGGATGTDRYAVAGIDQTTSYSIDFNKNLTYFGYWLSALDAGNQVAFYNGDQQLFSFAPIDVLALVSGTPAYFGNHRTTCGCEWQ